MAPLPKSRLLALALALALAGGLVWGWHVYTSAAAEPWITSGNGRIEATEIDIATRTPGRATSIRVDEGDFVSAGQTLAEMNTAVLDAQPREAEASRQRARIGIETAQSLVTQRAAEKNAVQALALPVATAFILTVVVQGWLGVPTTQFVMLAQAILYRGRWLFGGVAATGGDRRYRHHAVQSRAVQVSSYPCHHGPKPGPIADAQGQPAPSFAVVCPADPCAGNQPPRRTTSWKKL